ncbi:MAG: DNA-3-methyladenine glycosylase [Candidatus Babeliales bacterium]|jgi:DNA-3-methyladenine glycosylase
MISSLKQHLSPSFFDRPVLTVAHELIGCPLVIERNGVTKKLIIHEVEAYDGPDDLACHGRFGKTERTAAMFGPAGCWYVYLVYGMHWMLNIVTGPEGYPAAILIRGAGEFDGPGKLTKALSINKQVNRQPTTPASRLWIEPRTRLIPPSEIIQAPRIGVDYAGPHWANVPYRFILSLMK